MSNKKFTYRDLKEAVNKLTDAQLDKPVMLQREDEALRVAGLEELEQDIWYNVDEPDDRASLSDLKDLHGGEFDESKYRPGPTKGTPFLWEEF